MEYTDLYIHIYIQTNIQTNDLAERRRRKKRKKEEDKKKLCKLQEMRNFEIGYVWLVSIKQQHKNETTTRSTKRKNNNKKWVVTIQTNGMKALCVLIHDLVFSLIFMVRFWFFDVANLWVATTPIGSIAHIYTYISIDMNYEYLAYSLVHFSKCTYISITIDCNRARQQFRVYFLSIFNGCACEACSIPVPIMVIRLRCVFFFDSVISCIYQSICKYPSYL